MSGSLTELKAKWVKEFTGVDVSAPVASAVAAAPHSASKATATIKSPFGDFVYFPAADSRVEPVMSEAINEYLDTESVSDRLDEASTALGDLEDKYQDVDVNDLVHEIYQHTDRTLKDEAGQARGAGLVDQGFSAFLAKLVRELKTAKGQVEVAQKDIQAANLETQAAELNKMARELEEGISKVLDAAVDVAKVAADTENPFGWVDLAKDLFKDFLSEENPFAKQAAELEKQAQQLKMADLAEKVKLAREAFQGLVDDIKTWQPIVEQAGHDMAEKRNFADDNYDKKTKGIVRISDFKTAIDLAKTVHDTAMRTAGGGHRAKELLVGLTRITGPANTWMADVKQGEKIITSLIQTCEGMYRTAEPKVAWSNGLLKRFQQFYKVAGNAMADAPGTGT
jgi:hypothetical protein